MHQRGTSHAGIAFAEQGLRTIGQLIDGLVLIAAVLSDQDMKNHVEFL